LAKTLGGGGFPGRGDPKSCHVKARCKPSRRDAIVRLHVRIIRLSALRPPVHERLAAVEIDRDPIVLPPEAMLADAVYIPSAERYTCQ
jgi:hypothetical protein